MCNGSTNGFAQKQQQQKDEQAQGGTQKKKKVTAAQLRVQKGEQTRIPAASRLSNDVPLRSE
jgi:hypothetical protein